MTRVSPEAEGINYRVMRPWEVRSANSSAILRLLLAHGPRSRADIAETLGLTQGPVTRIVTQLIARGLVQEKSAEFAGGRGRPRVSIEVKPDAWHVVSIHIGIMQFAVRLIDLSGEVLAEANEHHDGDPAVVISRAGELAAEIASATHAPVLGVGVGSGGWVDATAGVVRRFDALGWRDVPIRDMLSERLPYPVHVESTVRAQATADILFGIAGGVSDFVHVFVGNIIGMAVVSGGKVRTGLDGFGGDLARWPVDVGDGVTRPSSEVISDLALTRTARAEGFIPPTATFKEVVESTDPAAGLSPAAEALLIERARRVGRMLGMVSAMLAPPLIIVSVGELGIRSTLEPLREAFTAELEDRPTPALYIDTRWRESLAMSGGAVVIEQELLAPKPARDHADQTAGR